MPSNPFFIYFVADVYEDAALASVLQVLESAIFATIKVFTDITVPSGITYSGTNLSN